jgi:hypothetical protein
VVSPRRRVRLGPNSSEAACSRQCTKAQASGGPRGDSKALGRLWRRTGLGSAGQWWGDGELRVAEKGGACEGRLGDIKYMAHRFCLKSRCPSRGALTTAATQDGGRQETWAGSGGEHADTRHARGARAPKLARDARGLGECGVSRCAGRRGPDVESGRAPRGTAHARGRARRILAGATSLVLTHLPLFDCT